MSAEWREIRNEFPALKGRVFLDTATFGQLPRAAQAAIQAHLRRRDETACADFLQWFDQIDEIRAGLAQLLDCQPGDIFFPPNAAFALSLLMHNLDWQPNDRLLTLPNEFPDNVYWPALVAKRGINWHVLSWPELLAWFPSGRLAILSTVNNITGFRPPLNQLPAPSLSPQGPLLYLDGTQSVGALRIKPRELRAAMLAVHGYKWMLAPTGAAFCYVAPEVRQWLEPLVVGWRSHHSWRSVTNLHDGQPCFSPAAERYEGAMPAFLPLLAMGASVRLILQIGPERIEQRVLSLARTLKERLQQLGAEFPPNRNYSLDSPILAVRFPKRSAEELVAGLREAGILTSARHGYLRISVHFYNLEEDLEKLLERLKQLV